VSFAEELARVLPADLPHRERVIELSAKHLALIAEANEYMNLTRISSPREAAIKHVADSVIPWRSFAGSRHVLDAGTGAGFPGIPLAIALPDVRFTLAESIQKKARFVEVAVEALDLANVEVTADRAESRAQTKRPEIITARAVAPAERLVDLFAKALQSGARLLLYKGPDVTAELEAVDGRRHDAKVLCRYELPDKLGTRTLVSITAQRRGARNAS